MTKDLIDILKYIGMALGAVLILVGFMLFCTGCMYKKFDFDKYWSDSSTRIEGPDQGVVIPHGYAPGPRVPCGPVDSYPTGLGDGSRTTLW